MHKKSRYLDEQAQGFVVRVAQAVLAIEPQQAWIYGSFLQKGMKAHDFDLVVIAEHFRRTHFHQRTIRALPNGLPIDLWPYTPQEWESLYPQGSQLRSEIQSGISLVT